MAITERSRSVLYRRLSDVVHDEEAVGELLSYFPARDVDEPATKEFVDARLADVRADFADLRAEFADLRADMAGMEQRLMTYVHQEVRATMRWTIGFLVSSQAVLVAAVTFSA